MRGRGDPKSEGTKQKIEDCFFKALQYFGTVLRHDEHNIYAANGIAAVLAEQDELVQAKEILISVGLCICPVAECEQLQQSVLPAPCMTCS